jgi:hypothetical protein
MTAAIMRIMLLFELSSFFLLFSVADINDKPTTIIANSANISNTAEMPFVAPLHPEVAI